MINYALCRTLQNYQECGFVDARTLSQTRLFRSLKLGSKEALQVLFEMGKQGFGTFDFSSKGFFFTRVLDIDACSEIVKQTILSTVDESLLKGTPKTGRPPKDPHNVSKRVYLDFKLAVLYAASKTQGKIERSRITQLSVSRRNELGRANILGLLKQLEGEGEGYFDSVSDTFFLKGLSPLETSLKSSLDSKVFSMLESLQSPNDNLETVLSDLIIEAYELRRSLPKINN